MKKTPLSEDLEYAALYAISRGITDANIVSEEELSKPGKVIYRSLLSLLATGRTPPFDTTAIGVTAVDVLGASRGAIKSYLLALQTATIGVEVKDILAKVRAKQILVELVNEAGSMLQKGILDVGLLNGVITRDSGGVSDIRPLSEMLTEGFPEPPIGITLDSLPTISEAIGGLYGMVAISGLPGIGKTALAWQVALDVGQKIPVIYDDFENGLSVLMNRTRSIVGGDLERARHITRNIYYRDSVRTLDADLAVIQPPACIVVDSVQKLPGSVTHRRESLDKWVHKLEYLKKRGYHVIIVSEVPRSQYNQDAYIGAYKESGEIEYSADTGIQLLSATDNMIEVHIVKNRHRPTKGFVTMLRREQEWRFREWVRN